MLRTAWPASTRSGRDQETRLRVYPNRTSGPVRVLRPEMDFAQVELRCRRDLPTSGPPHRRRGWVWVSTPAGCPGYDLRSIGPLRPAVRAGWRSRTIRVTAVVTERPRQVPATGPVRPAAFDADARGGARPEVPQGSRPLLEHHTGGTETWRERPSRVDQRGGTGPGGRTARSARRSLARP